MEAESKAIGMQKLPHKHLRFGVLPLDLVHVVASYFGIMDVHGLKVVSIRYQDDF